MLDPTRADFFSQPAIPALVFGSQRYVVVPLTGTPGFNFSIWLRGDGGPVYFIGRPDEGLGFADTTTFVSVTVGATTRVNAQGVQCTFATPALVDGGWHHLAVRLRDANTVISVWLVVDGLQIGPPQMLVPFNDKGERQGLRWPSELVVGADLQLDDGRAVPKVWFNGRLRDFAQTGTYPLRGEGAWIPPDPIGDGVTLWQPAPPLDGPSLDMAAGQFVDPLVPTDPPPFPGQPPATWSQVFGQNPVFGSTNSVRHFPTGDRTVELWARGPNSGYLFGYGPIGSSSMDNDGGQPWWISAGLLPGDDHWHHLAVVVQGDVETRYLDGVAVSTGQPPSPLVPNQLVLVGARYATDAWDAMFTGQMRHVRLWSSARTAGQIQRAAAGHRPDSWDNLVADWPLDPARPGEDRTGYGGDLNFTAVQASPGRRFRDPGPDDFQTDVMVGGRLTRIIASRRPQLLLKANGSGSYQAGMALIPNDRDVQVYGHSVTGSIAAGPGHTLKIVSDTSTDAGDLFRRRFYLGLIDRRERFAASLYAGVKAVLNG